MSEAIRESGVVDRFDPKRGFGFIIRDSKKPNVFVHQTNIKMSGYRELKPGQKVTFEVVPSEKEAGKEHAVNVTPDE